MNKQTILLVDDDSDAVLSLSRALKAAGLSHKIASTSLANKAIEIQKEELPHVMVVDLCLEPKLGVESGFKLIAEILTVDTTCRIIVLTGHGSMEHGVRAINCGAANFIEKPADIPHLIALINDGVKQAEIRRHLLLLQQEEKNPTTSIIIGDSDATKQILEKVNYAATTNQPVLITGETGTGKGLCAWAIHRISRRADQRFVKYQTSYGTSDLVNSDLFGHLKGSYTGATEDRIGLIQEANQGTLFLDEIDELPLESQVTLLSVLQDKKFRPVGGNKLIDCDFRLISALNADVNKCVEDGKIRKDFYHRIAHFKIHLPPLRERLSDIPKIATHVLNRLQEREQINVIDIDKSAIETLTSYNWPGNIRELEAVIEGAAYHADYHKRRVITSADLQNISEPTNNSVLKINGPSTNFYQQIANYELEVVQTALRNNGDNQVKAAETLGINRTTLRRILAGTKGRGK